MSSFPFKPGDLIRPRSVAWAGPVAKWVNISDAHAAWCNAARWLILSIKMPFGWSWMPLARTPEIWILTEDGLKLNLVGFDPDSWVKVEL